MYGRYRLTLLTGWRQFSWVVRTYQSSRAVAEELRRSYLIGFKAPCSLSPVRWSSTSEESALHRPRRGKSLDELFMKVDRCSEEGAPLRRCLCLHDVCFFSWNALDSGTESIWWTHVRFFLFFRIHPLWRLFPSTQQPNAHGGSQQPSICSGGGGVNI